MAGREAATPAPSTGQPACPTGRVGPHRTNGRVGDSTVAPAEKPGTRTGPRRGARRVTKALGTGQCPRTAEVRVGTEESGIRRRPVPPDAQDRVGGGTPASHRGRGARRRPPEDRFTLVVEVGKSGAAIYVECQAAVGLHGASAPPRPEPVLGCAPTRRWHVRGWRSGRPATAGGDCSGQGEWPSSTPRRDRQPGMGQQAWVPGRPDSAGGGEAAGSVDGRPSSWTPCLSDAVDVQRMMLACPRTTGEVRHGDAIRAAPAGGRDGGSGSSCPGLPAAPPCSWSPASRGHGPFVGPLRTVSDSLRGPPGSPVGPGPGSPRAAHAPVSR